MADDVSPLALEVGGLTFDALAAGPDDGPLVLLLHGFPQTSHAWRPLLGPLAAAGYRAVAPDQRGYSPGARPAGDAAYDMDELVGDVAGLADVLGADRFHLVGHDWGGAVAWQAAVALADRVRTLTSLSTPHPRALGDALRGDLGGDQASRSSYMDLFVAEGTAAMMTADDAAGLRMIFEGSGLSGDPTPYVEALGTEEALDAALAWYRAARTRLAGSLGDVSVPTLYVWGTEDIALGREAAEATASHVSGPYHFVALDGVGHWLVESAPDVVTDLVLDHLAAS